MNNTSPRNFTHLAVTYDIDRNKKHRSKCFCGATIPLNTQYRVYLCTTDDKPSHFNIFDHKHLQKGIAVGSKSSYKVPSPKEVKAKTKGTAIGQSSYTIPKPNKKRNAC